MMSALAAEKNNAVQFAHNTLRAARKGNIATLLSPARVLRLLFDAFYILVELVIIWLFKPPAPPENFKPRGRIAVIGAGLTGVSSAAHAIAHGFDVVIYDQHESIGGIWANVNATSGLQLNSLLYRFHPGVLWSSMFPRRDAILSEIRRTWKEYHLEPRTHLNTRVTSVRRATPEEMDNVPEEDLDPCQQGHARWIVNDGADGVFDAVIVTIGTCGEPQWVKFPGMPDMEEIKARRVRSQEDARDSQESPSPDKDESKTESEADAEERKHSQLGNKADAEDKQEEGEGDGETFAGTLLHSSELDDAQLAGKRVVVIGSGASGVEAVETALARGAQGCVMVARQDKWVIPRNMIIDTLISAQPFGREMPLSFIWEKFITIWNYHGVEDLTPAHLGLFQGTPVVNDEFLDHVRAGRCKYIRGDTQGLTRGGVKVSVRGRSSKPGDEGEEEEFPADVIVLATGFKKPEIGFLPEDLFPETYERPNLYLQNFATEDWSVLMTNSSYMNAIGHIGIYMRILLTFLMDEDARPSPKDMKLWVDVLRFVKRGARGGALGFFTYMELTIWFLLFHIFRLDRLRWMFFIMQGWGVHPEPAEPGKEDAAKEGSAPISELGLVRDWVKAE
ncbi:FAD/NAD-P-binding domain-containing protein [Rhodofomes roseus]|uniref:FAD/NAD-P-binding domain-containing protein n=1 Tax=Rhodofomes roseus TaxID=34475 RepID=A0ABQ8KR59_9APHY|nr:FAD/NAD-P-binding domain-containing protein [Rhodofomes roseus]KAH9840185.1 FAD/NAD-P-binding domain-containing protein [Rhodofomes roseus]